MEKSTIHLVSLFRLIMQPIGNHIKILPLEETQKIRVEKGAYQAGTVVVLSPDITTHLQAGQEIQFVRGKKIINPEGVFVNDDNIVCYR